jgi:PleD family two-component response regulator
LFAAVKRVHEDPVRLRQQQALLAVSRPMQPAVRSLDHVPLIEGPTVVGGPRPLSSASPLQQVLVVDDEEHSLRRLATELPARGVEVHRVCNGAQAPDLVA